MTTSSLLLAVLLSSAPTQAAPAIAGPAPDVATSTRESRPLAVSAATTTLGVFPLFGVDLSYHLTDRVAVGVQVMSLLYVYEASAYLRFVALARPRSGLFVEAGAHALAAMMAEGTWGASAAVGYEWRLPGGFTAAVSLGALALRDSCEYCGSASNDSSWIFMPTGTVRLGYAF